MNGEWSFWAGAFTPEECSKILEDGLKLEGRDATLGVSGMTENTNTNYRRSKTRFIQATDPTFEWVFDRIWKMGLRVNREWFNFHITNLSYIQLAEYDESYQGEYKKHQDVFYISGNEYHRKLTCLIQLTDTSEYEGGEFEVYDLNEYPDANSIKQQGTAIFIPSFVTHAALPVTKGTRYSLAVWFEGPHWV